MDDNGVPQDWQHRHSLIHYKFRFLMGFVDNETDYRVQSRLLLDFETNCLRTIKFMSPL